jgi:hypothetical protein
MTIHDGKSNTRCSSPIGHQNAFSNPARLVLHLNLNYVASKPHITTQQPSSANEWFFYIVAKYFHSIEEKTANIPRLARNQECCG